MLFSFLFTLNALKIHLCRLYVCVEICIFFFDVCNRTSQHSCLYSFQVYFSLEAPECSIANILYKKDNLTSNKRVFSLFLMIITICSMYILSRWLIIDHIRKISRKRDKFILLNVQLPFLCSMLTIELALYK